MSDAVARLGKKPTPRFFLERSRCVVEGVDQPLMILRHALHELLREVVHQGHRPDEQTQKRIERPRRQRRDLEGQQRDLPNANGSTPDFRDAFGGLGALGPLGRVWHRRSPPGSLGPPMDPLEALDFAKNDGLVTAIAIDDERGDVLMVAFMNEQSLRRTLETGEVHYWSRSRNKLWKKGESSGNLQEVKEIRVDCDDDCVLIKVNQIGDAACHTGYRSCFYRRVPVGTDYVNKQQDGQVGLEWTDTEKVFDPQEVYGDSPNPTVL